MTMSVKQSGVWYPVTGLYVKQSGSWQPVQTGYVKQSGAWNIFYSSGLYNGSMTAGYDSDYSSYQAYGYSQLYSPNPMGSVTPGTLNDGKTFYELFDYYIISPSPTLLYGKLTISGFTSDPGAAYFSTMTIDSTVYYSSGSGVSYGYSGGLAAWVYTSGFGFSNLSTYSVVIA